MTAPARVLAIAGSDSGGGAGIEADIKTISALGGYALTTITAVTAQNTLVLRASISCRRISCGSPSQPCWRISAPTLSNSAC